LTTTSRQAEHARSTSHSTVTWRHRRAARQRVNCFNRRRGQEACRRSRNCVTCVDSSNRLTHAMRPYRLTTKGNRTAARAIPRSLLPSVVKQQTTNANGRGRVSGTARARAVSKIEIEIGCGGERLTLSVFGRWSFDRGLLAAPLRR